MKIDLIPPLTMPGLTPAPNGFPQTPMTTKTALSAPATHSNTGDVDKIIRELAQTMEPFNVSLRFSKDEDTGTIVIEMVNQTTGEKLQQIPNEATLRVAAVLGKLQGQLFSHRA